VETHPSPGDVDRSRDDPVPHLPIPDYLQPFIVAQDPERYTPIDQAVWRFVLLQLHDRLKRSAHPSYSRGLAQSAISPNRIPSIAEIDRGLGSIGWGAVCVDGFIPPRAFQAFQALGVLPIAAEIRSREHLPYTPAPDIIHEAAGHAPILIDPVYAAYVRAVGEVGTRAFSSPADDRLDRAVRVLSELKEHPTDDALLRGAEIELERAVASLGAPSEASRISRLYWWTAEYGLVGTPRDYHLYGAGLLSSLGESHFCHGESVRKRELTPECTLESYDITRPQPQLFVARDFEHLHGVLSEVSQTLAYEIGGDVALRAALTSQRLCTLYLPGGAQVIGTLSGVEGDTTPALASFGSEGAALARRGQLLGRAPRHYHVPLGKLASGGDPRQVLVDASAHRDANGRLSVEYASGVRVSGIPTAGPFEFAEAVAWLRDFRLEWHGRIISSTEPYPWLCAERVITAGAGSASPQVSPLDPGESAGIARQAIAIVPKSRHPSPAEARLERLYARAHLARAEGAAGRATLESLHAELDASYPHEWLLAWNLLESLFDLGLGQDPLVRELERRLRSLEHHYEGRHPIALGLDYLVTRKEGAPGREARDPH
jgi:phenylalanine-4-hydroxylase